MSEALPWRLPESNLNQTHMPAPGLAQLWRRLHRSATHTHAHMRACARAPISPISHRSCAAVLLVASIWPSALWARIVSYRQHRCWRTSRRRSSRTSRSRPALQLFSMHRCLLVCMRVNGPYLAMHLLFLICCRYGGQLARRAGTRPRQGQTASRGDTLGQEGV